MEAVCGELEAGAVYVALWLFAAWLVLEGSVHAASIAQGLRLRVGGQRLSINVASQVRGGKDSRLHEACYRQPLFVVVRVARAVSASGTVPKSPCSSRDFYSRCDEGCLWEYCGSRRASLGEYVCEFGSRCYWRRRRGRSRATRKGERAGSRRWRCRHCSTCPRFYVE